MAIIIRPERVEGSLAPLSFVLSLSKDACRRMRGPIIVRPEPVEGCLSKDAWPHYRSSLYLRKCGRDRPIRPWSGRPQLSMVVTPIASPEPEQLPGHRVRIYKDGTGGRLS